MLLKGTLTRSAEQIATQIESLGGSIDSHGGNNSFGAHTEVLSSDFVTGLDILSEVILHPTFPPAELERERQLQLASIRAQKDQLLQCAGRSMRRALFGERGYGLNVNGTEESVAQIRLTDLQAFHQKMVVPNNCVLAIYGDINVNDIRANVEKYFGSWQGGKLSLTELPVPSKPLNIERVIELRDKKQAVLVIGFLGTSIFDPDRYALELLQEACSDLGSRLFMSIRDNLGLAYYVGAQNFLGLAPGYFSFYAGTAAEKVGLVETEIFKETALLCSEGLTPEELKRSKAKLIGQKKIERQDLGNLAMLTALDELYGLGYAISYTEDARYESVTVEQIKAVAQKYLQPNAAVISLILPEKP
jgi:zinc protease